MIWIIGSYVFILGTVFTSFLTLLGMRLPEGRTLLGRSECDACGKTIPWYGLIPIVGYLFVKGKCPYCGGKVSLIYPLYELLNGLIFAGGYLYLQDNVIEYIIMMLFVMLMTTVSVSDAKHQLVPDKVLLVFGPPIIILRLLFPLTTPLYALLGGVFGFLFMWFLAWYGKKRFKQDALGGGDIKLYVIIGVVLEIHLVFLSLFFAALFGLIVGKALMKKMNPIPFVPFIYIGSLIAYVFGPRLLELYLGLL